MTNNDQQNEVSLETPSETGDSQEKGKKKVRIDTRTLIIYISQNALVAAIYFVLTSFTQPISFGAMQIRIAEALGLLCFWRPDFAIGMTIGCFLSNVYSFSPWDMLFGSLATLVSCLLISYASKWLWMGIVYPVVINGLVVGAELTWIFMNPVGTYVDFAVQGGWVALGELGAMAIGYVLWMIICRLKIFNKVFKPVRHQTVKF